MYLKSQSAAVLSAQPVARRYSLNGLNDTSFIPVVSIVAEDDDDDDKVLLQAAVVDNGVLVVPGIVGEADTGF